MTLAIETSGLSKSYGPVRAVESVDLRVERGEIYGFVGLNGAGKTTTIRSLLGMVHPDAGSVRVLGQAVGPGGRGPWRQVGHLVEAPAAYPELTVRENLEIARRLHHMPDAGAVARIIERLGLASYADRKAGALSTGNLQRLGLARALLHEPALVILDEPANGLDPAGVVEIRELLGELARQRGVLGGRSGQCQGRGARQGVKAADLRSGPQRGQGELQVRQGHHARRGEGRDRRPGAAAEV